MLRRKSFVASQAVAVAILLGFGSALAVQPKIEVIYPKPKQKIAAVDSMFIFGNVTAGSNLVINGAPITVHPNGAYLAFLPVVTGNFVFNLKATLNGDSAFLDLPIVVPAPYLVPDGDSITIVDGYMTPSYDLTLREGDILNVSFRGSPARFGYFNISTDDPMMPMAESSPSKQSYWAEAVFGKGAYPDSLLLRGVYTGTLLLEKKHLSDSTRVTFYLCRKAVPKPGARGKELATILQKCDCAIRKNDFEISVEPQNLILIGELTDSATALRTFPRSGYLPIFQPAGVRFRITGKAGGFYRGQLTDNQELWIPDSVIKLLPQGAQIPRGEVTLVRTRKVEQGTIVSFNAGAILPFQVDEDITDREINLDIYNCTSNIDWMRYDNSDSLIKLIRWSQPDGDVMRLTIDLQQGIWGYDCFYEGTVFNLKLRGRPDLEHRLRDVRFVIDPGHNPDPGSIGPTGFMEKDANLAIALELRDFLREKGATVVMTREGDSGIALNERARVAYRNNADIFISIHNNALPDGVNPFFNHGTSTFYGHPHSRAFAEAVQIRLLKATGLEDIGLYSRHLAVTRPTGYLALLLECAFMIIPEQEIALRDPEYQKKIARGIFEGIEEFIESEREEQRMCR